VLEAIDTVMNDEELGKLLVKAKKEQWTHKPHPIFEVEKCLLLTQAEISFPKGEKQGIDKGRKEVVETFERLRVRKCVPLPQNFWRAWQKQLKEWGL